LILKTVFEDIRSMGWEWLIYTNHIALIRVAMNSNCWLVYGTYPCLNRPVMYKIFNSSVRKMKQHMNCLPLYGKHTTVIHVKLPEGNSNCWLNHQTNQPVIIPTQTHHVPFIARPCEPTVMLRRPPERPNISEVLKDCWSIRL
jgi:hypothetical protein